MFYCAVILICMFLISITNFFISKSIFNFDLGYIIVAVVISTVSVIIVDGIFATIVRRVLPEKWFTQNRKVFCAGNKECRFYEKIGIKKWKELVLELGVFTNFRKNKIAKPTDNLYLARYILEANYGVVCHVACIAFGYTIIFIYPLEYFLFFGVPVSTVNAVLNLLPLFILRYTLPKLHSLYKFNQKRQIEKTEN